MTAQRYEVRHAKPRARRTEQVTWPVLLFVLVFYAGWVLLLVMVGVG